MLDKKYLNWGSSIGGVGSCGCYLKFSEVINSKKYYYKLSNYNAVSGFFGHESINEVICSRLF